MLVSQQCGKEGSKEPDVGSVYVSFEEERPKFFGTKYSLWRIMLCGGIRSLLLGYA